MIRLTLLGGLALTDADGTSLQPILSQPKRLAVLVYLALAGAGKFRRRDIVLGLFWPDATEDRARRSLNQTLHFLRQQLGPKAIVSRGPAELGISPDALWCDVTAFDWMVKAGDLAGALQLYDGELLPGFFTDADPEFDQWLTSERTRLQRTAYAAAWQLAEAAERDQHFGAAAEWGRTAVALSLNDETSARNLIQLLDRIGDRAGALEAYSSFATRLAREYDTEPSAETRRLVARIRASAGVRLGSPERADEPDGAAPEHHSAEMSVDAPGDNFIRASNAAPSSDTAPGAPSDGRPHPAARVLGKRRYHFLVAALVIGLGVAAILAYSVGARFSRSGAGSPRASIIVRELEAVGAGNDSVHVARALTSAVVGQLAQVRSFNVVAVSAGETVRRVRSRSPAVPHILVTGNVVRSGAEIRVNLQIADAESGRTIKTAMLDRPLGPLLPLVDSLSLQISSLVRTAVGREVRLREWSSATRNERAYMLMQEADEHRDRASQLTASGDFSAAVRALSSADSVLVEVERVSGAWQEPMIERAGVLQSLGAMYLIPPIRNLTKVRTLLARGVAEARRAVTLSPGDPSALEALGSVEYWYWLAVPLPADSARFALASAEKNLRAAVAADPRRASAWSLLSASLYARADYVGSYLTADRAYRADAYLRSSETILDVLFLTAYEMNDMPTATRWCDEINSRLGPGWLSAYCRLRLLSSDGRKDDRAIAAAWRLATQAGTSTGDTSVIPPQLQMRVAVVIAQQGLRDSAEAVARAARVRGNGDPEIVPDEAEVRIELGQTDSAAALMAGYVTANPSHRAGVARSRRFIGLTQLQRLLAQMKIPQSARK